MIAKIEAVVGRKVFLSRGGVDQKMACELCVALLNQIQTLEQQLLSCKTDLASKYASANSAPVKRSRFDLEQNHILNLIFYRNEAQPVLFQKKICGSISYKSV